MSFRLTTLGAAMIALALSQAPAFAKKCGNNSAGFPQWVSDFSKEALAKGISQRTLNTAFKDVFYNTKTIWADRNQKSFKLSYEEFLKKRGASTIISQGRKKKAANQRTFANIEARYGVPAGPLIAIWGMETAFGSFQGDQNMMSAVTTLAYDCRRSAFFEEQLYAALQLVQKGQLQPAEMIGIGRGIPRPQPVQVICRTVRVQHVQTSRRGPEQSLPVVFEHRDPFAPFSSRVSIRRSFADPRAMLRCGKGRVDAALRKGAAASRSGHRGPDVAEHDEISGKARPRAAAGIGAGYLMMISGPMKVLGRKVLMIGM